MLAERTPEHLFWHTHQSIVQIWKSRSPEATDQSHLKPPAYPIRYDTSIILFPNTRVQKPEFDSHFTCKPHESPKDLLPNTDFWNTWGQVTILSKQTRMITYVCTLRSGSVTPVKKRDPANGMWINGWMVSQVSPGLFRQLCMPKSKCPRHSKKHPHKKQYMAIHIKKYVQNTDAI